MAALTMSVPKVVALLLSILLPMGGGARGLRKVWDLDLTRWLIENQVIHKKGLPVFALRFSPDGKRLAVVADEYLRDGDFKSRLLIVQVGHPQETPVHFEIDAGINENEIEGPSPAFEWSPSGDIISAAQALINISRGTQCKILNFGALVTDQMGVSFDTPYTFSKGEPTRINLFDFNCRATGTWEVQEKWVLEEVSQDRSVLLVGRLHGSEGIDNFLLVDPTLQKVIHRWPARPVHGRQFAERGKVLCNASEVDVGGKVPVECFDVETGAKIAEAPTINGGSPMQTATKASRLIASDYRRRLDITSDNLLTATLRRRVVWDFRSGKELCSWHPKWQEYGARFTNEPKLVRDPFRFAISPDGNYIVEGGNAILHLYKIEP